MISWRNKAIFRMVILSLLLISAGSVNLFARQGITVSGKITDSSGSLPGVNVRIKGTTVGVVTDVSGAYSITVPDGNAVLQYSFVGYAPQEITVGDRRTIDVELAEDTKELEEVVVVGYGVQKRVNLTGAVGSVDSKDITSRVSPNTSTLLQGRVPGLRIVQNSGMPGSEQPSIQIRGMGTFSKAGNDPLVLIDGVEGDITKLNPNAIENVAVLKDASSAAIYGSRAANGVILVTTKNGKEGRLNIEYSYNIGFQNPTVLQDRILNSVEYMELTNQAARHTGTATTALYSDAQIAEWKAGQDPNSATYDPAQYPNTNWMDYLFQKNAPLQQHYLSVNGGKNGTTYNFGMGYLDQDGILIATDYKRYDLQMNMKTNLGGRVTFGSSISFAKGNRHDTAISGGSPLDFNNSEDQMLSAYSRSPLQTPKLPDGSGRYTARAYPDKGGNKNPIAIAENGGTNWDDYYVLGNAFLKVDILPGLYGEIRGAVKYTQKEGKALTVSIKAYDFFPDVNGVHIESALYNGQNNTLTVRNDQDIQFTAYGILNYSKTFAQKHNLTAMLGYEQESYQFNRLEGYRAGVPGIMWELDATPTAGQVAKGNSREWALQSVFGRVNYDFVGKYLLEANFRYDGTSRLPSRSRWGLFPSFSAGWRFSEELFAKTDWLNNAKLRTSWGQLGNQNIGDTVYPYQESLSTTVYNVGGNVSQGWMLLTMPNADIQWETTTVVNVGFDFGIFDGLLSGSVDWYNKKTINILRELQLPTHTGLKSPYVNDGEMRNRGWEVNLFHGHKFGDFTYSVGVNFDANRNKVLKFGAREIDTGNGYIRQEGLPYNSYYMYIFDGIYQNADEISKLAPLSTLTKPGDLRYKHFDEVTAKMTPDDRQVVDGAFPNFNYGFNINAAWKSFDLSMFFQGVQGKKVYVKEWGIAPFRQASAPPVYWRGAWTAENPNNSIPHIFYDNYAPNTYPSTFWLQDASYLRLKNIQVGYTLPAEWTRKILIQNLRVYFSGDNLLTFTKMFQGLDPERVALNSRGAIYPQSKIFSFGIKVTL